MNAAVFFQGQGRYPTYYVRTLVKQNDLLKRIWKNAEDILGWPIFKLLEQIDDAGTLTTDKAQPFIFLMDYTVWTIFHNNLSVPPKFLAGHSLGELTAITAGGACSFEEGVKLVKRRGELMQAVNPDISQGMLAVLGCNHYEVEHICEKARKYTGTEVWCANFNSPTQQIVAGNQEALHYIAGMPKIKSHELHVTRAFHTPFMEVAADQFYQELCKIHFSIPEIPVISNVTAKPYQTSWSIPELLYRQVKNPVRWMDTMHYLLERGIMTYILITENAPFRSMDRELRDSLQWSHLEAVANGELVDFESDYPSRTEARFTGKELVASMLRCMISSQWPQDVMPEKIIKAQQLYDRVAVKAKQKECSQLELDLIISDVIEVLRLKREEEEYAQEILKSVLNSYGIWRHE